MKICLINPSQKQERLGSFGKFAPAIPPTGLAYIAAVLIQDGFEVVIIDQHARRWDNVRLLKEVCIIRPDVVGFSCLTFVMDSVEDASKKIRSQLPNIKIVLGNIHPTIFHREIIESGLADFVVRGEGENTMRDLCIALRDNRDLRAVDGITFRDNGKLRVNPDRSAIKDLDSLPYPQWELLVGPKYDAFGVKIFENCKFPVPMLASRGCAFHCEFCSQNIVYKGLRKRNLFKVADEIEYLCDRVGHRAFGFIDANFPPDINYGHNFADEVVKRGLQHKIVWFCETRVDMVDKDLLRHLYQAGLRLVQFGVESGDAEVLKLMNKSFLRETAINAFRWARETGLITVGLFMIGMPAETRRQIEDTLRFARKLKPDLVKFSIATPYPGSFLWERYKEFLIEQPTWKYSGWLDINAHDGSYLLEEHRIPSRELLYLQRKGMFLFYSQPRILKRLFLDDLLPLSLIYLGFLTFLQIVFSNLVNFIKRILKNEKGISVSAG